MTTPSREEAPERVWVILTQQGLWTWPSKPGSPSTEYLRADLANREPSEGDAITVDSTIYGQEFYGILNADGQFWTPLPFDCEGLARLHIAHFWNTPQQVEHFMRGAKIVPVRVQLTVIQAPEEKP